MKARLGRIKNALMASLWFVPMLLVLLSVGAALLLIELDRRLNPDAVGVAGLIFQGGPEGARAVLSAIAASMMTVTGVTFSITVVTLTLAAQQYTPRVLRHFTADRGNQVVLGVFIGTFIYSLLVLRTVRMDSYGMFVPQMAVTGGVVLSITSLAFLIYFIHHVASMIQPSSIIQRVAECTHELIDHLFPEPLGEDAGREEAESEGFPKPPGEGVPILASEGGFLQGVDLEALMKLAREEDLVVRMERIVGEYVPRKSLLATVWPTRRISAELIRRVNRCFAFGRDRTMQQDPDYGVLQISDIGVKALSPGINDPTTAVTCVNFLGAILRHLGRRGVPSALRKDPEGRLRVIAQGTNFERMTDLAFSQIRHYGEGDPHVTECLLKTLAEVATELRDSPERRQVLQRHLREIRAGIERGIRSTMERDRLLDQFRRTEEALETPPAFSTEATRRQVAA